MLGDDGDNINGPSLIRVPDWIENPLGRYYLYFAHHKGDYIRLAYSDDLEGRWQIHAPGTLRLEQTICRQHIASPDVHIDHANRQVRMYFHGVIRSEESRSQNTLMATSGDGLTFTASPDLLGGPYFRVFHWNGLTYAIDMPGELYRSADGVSDFKKIETLFSEAESVRHTAVLVEGDILHVFHTNVGDAPEQIRLTSFHLHQDESRWRRLDTLPVLRPEMPYEGADLPVKPSQDGRNREPANQLRDPAVFAEDGILYLLYTVAGEEGIAIAKVNYPA